MPVQRPKILVVDDEPFNVDYLEQELADLGYDTVTAFDGRQALDQVRAASPDLVLLDIMMPVMDGFTVLAHLKGDPLTRDLPVIIISAMNDLQSVVRGIQQGADDYLPKPFEPVLLRARISAGLERKLRRDRELEYLRQVEQLTAAAQAVQSSAYDETALASVAAREDALGDLARVFRKMAQEVVAREQRLRQQMRQLQLDIEEQRSSVADTAAVYMPMDRRQALAEGRELPEHAHGAALTADISGFTPLTEMFARELGLQRGAEEITRQVNRVLAALIGEVHRFRGSVVLFGGDALTCWFDGDAGRNAVACAFAIQSAMKQFAGITAPGGMVVSIGVKVAVAAGPARRLLVGDPGRQVIDVLAGRVTRELAEVEKHARKGEVVVTRLVAETLGDAVTVTEWRGEKAFACVTAVNTEATADPWPELSATAIADDAARVWMPPAVYEKVLRGQSAFLSELRPAATLFLRFAGVDFDSDADAQPKLDAFVRWVEGVAERHDGAVLQVAVGGDGGQVCMNFGAPIGHYDDALRAVRAALMLRSPPIDLAWVTCLAVGVACGPMRAGAYGSSAYRAYSVIGDRANLAARLMMAAAPGSALCDDAAHAGARDRIDFEAQPPLAVKGKSDAVAVYRPISERGASATPATHDRATAIDRLAPGPQLVLKAASVIGHVFAFGTLHDICPDESDRPNLDAHLENLVAEELIALAPDQGDRIYAFVDANAREAAYGLLLFAQRRQLHRSIAEWLERAHATDLAPHFVLLARHWRAADEPARAGHFLEMAVERARQRGEFEEARRYLDESLALDATSSVLSSDYGN
jgi:DNA-binding response OmpR family regulator